MPGGKRLAGQRGIDRRAGLAESFIASSSVCGSLISKITFEKRNAMPVKLQYGVDEDGRLFP